MTIFEPPITAHPSWCDHDMCVPAFMPPDDKPQHRVRLTTPSDGIQVEISQFDDDAAPKLGVLGEDDMTLQQVDEFINALTAARDRLAEVH